jgi:hypothetical protein
MMIFRKDLSCAGEKKLMKSIVALFACILIMSVLGCSGNDKDRATASSGSMPSLPNEARGAAGAGTTSAENAWNTDAKAAGGSNLQVSTPYQTKGTTVSQNVNPSPYLNATEGLKAGGQNAELAGGLISRRDGTMFGPTDQPAAGIGPGMQGTAQPATSAGTRSTRGGGAVSAPVKPPSSQTTGK